MEKEADQDHSVHPMKITKKTGKIYSVKGKGVPTRKNTKQKGNRRVAVKTAKTNTIKVVINNCYGGFSLSPKAVHRLACRQGKPCYFFTSEFTDGKPVFNPVKGYPEGLFWVASTSKELNEDNYGGAVFEVRPKNRADPDLVAVVEELKEEANGSCAELKIVEVPADVKWHIAEYDGNEWVAEDHRTWS